MTEVTDVLVQPAPDSRTIIAISERLAIVETQQRSTKEDMAVVRSTLHAINNEITKFVAAEQKCVDYLSRIADATKELPTISNMVTSFAEMRPELRTLLSERDQRTGLSEFGKKFAMIVVAAAAAVALIGGIGAGLIWMAQHLKT